MKPYFSYGEDWPLFLGLSFSLYRFPKVNRNVIWSPAWIRHLYDGFEYLWLIFCFDWSRVPCERLLQLGWILTLLGLLNSSDTSVVIVWVREEAPMLASLDASYWWPSSDLNLVLSLSPPKEARSPLPWIQWVKILLCCGQDPHQIHHRARFLQYRLVSHSHRAAWATKPSKCDLHPRSYLIIHGVVPCLFTSKELFSTSSSMFRCPRPLSLVIWSSGFNLFNLSICEFWFCFMLWFKSFSFFHGYTKNWNIN